MIKERVNEGENTELEFIHSCKIRFEQTICMRKHTKDYDKRLNLTVSTDIAHSWNKNKTRVEGGVTVADVIKSDYFPIKAHP